MTWTPWSKAEEVALAGYARPDAVQLITPLDRGTSRRDLVRAIYDTLSTAGVRYAPEKYAPQAELQEIRAPEEILRAPGEGTCLDLALLVAGVCLGYELLPLIVVFDDHAIVAVSTRFGRREQRDAGRGAELDWSDRDKGRIAEVGALTERITDGDYLAIECTGFARANALASGVPEGRDRVDGLLTFDAACRAGAAQFGARTFRFALDVAALQDRWRVRSPETLGARADYRAEVDQLLAYYAGRPLVGREQVLDRLTRFANQEPPGCLLVEGDAMFGKSALFAELVRRIDSGTWDAGTWESGIVPDVAFFFVREEQKRNTAAAFLAAVNAQLLVLVGSTGGVVGDLEAQRSQLLQLWARAGRAADAYRPLLLLVDGLDEMATDGLTVLDVLPPADRPYVHVIASSRPWALPVLDHQHPLGTAERLALDHLDEIALTELLADNGADPHDAARLAGRVLAVTRGEPLFSSLVSADVAAGGEPRLAELEAQGVAGVRDYFRADFAQLQQRVDSEAAEEVLGLLAVVRGGIALAEIAAALGVTKLRVDRAVAPMRRFLRGGDRVRLMHRELQRIVAQELFLPADLDRFAEKLATWCATFAPRWDTETPEYALRHGIGHLAERVRAHAEPAERSAWSGRLAEAVNDTFVDLHERRIGHPRALMDDLDRALAACALDTGELGYLRVVRTATLAARFRREGLRPARTFDLARQGDLDGARRRLAAFAVDEPWRQATSLVCAWLAAPAAAEEARRLLHVTSGGLAPGLELLAGRVAVDVDGAPPPATALQAPPDEWRARSIVAQIGGRIPDDPSALAEPLVAGEQVLEELERGRETSLTWTGGAAPAPTSDEAPVYRAEVEGPMLVSYAAAAPLGGKELLRDYIVLHAANPYVQYRNRSLWALLLSVVHHPDTALVQELVEQLTTAALGGGSVIVDDCLVLTGLAVLSLNGHVEAPAVFEERITEVRDEAGRLSHERGQGDSWSGHKRRLGCLAESVAKLLDDRPGAAALVEQGLGLPFGYAGYQAPGCLTLAESALVCGAGDDAVQAALRAAVTAAHNVQDPRFCARTTSRINALTRRWWPAMPLDDTVARFLADPAAPQFAGVHVVGEPYERRAQHPGMVPLPNRIRHARTFATLARDVYECSVQELLRINAGTPWGPDDLLPDGLEVAVPDPELAPLLAARFAAEALAVAELSPEARRSTIQRLVPLAVTNVTAMDTILGRLLLTVAFDVDVDDIEELVLDLFHQYDMPPSSFGSQAAFLS